MRGHGVAGKGAPIHQQHPMPLARQQHRGRCAGYTGANDDRIVHGIPFPFCAAFMINEGLMVRAFRA